jgi:hypothetical protein
MFVKVFDTHVRTQDGRYLHFDVLTDRDAELAKSYARQFLMDKGVHDEDISQSQCQFCHSEPANPQVVAAINDKGYFIITLQGFEE